MDLTTALPSKATNNVSKYGTIFLYCRLFSRDHLQNYRALQNIAPPPRKEICYGFFNNYRELLHNLLHSYPFSLSIVLESLIASCAELTQLRCFWSWQLIGSFDVIDKKVIATANRSRVIIHRQLCKIIPHLQFGHHTNSVAVSYTVCAPVGSLKVWGTRGLV